MGKNLRIPLARNANIVLGSTRHSQPERLSAGLMGFVMALFLVMLSFVWLNVAVNNCLRTIGAIEQSLQHSKALNEKLRAEATRLSSFGRIQRIAHEELGLDFLPQQDIIEVTDAGEHQ